MIGRKLNRSEYSAKQLGMIAKTALDAARVTLMMEGDSFDFNKTITSLKYAKECLHELTEISADCPEVQAKANLETKKAIESLIIYLHYQVIQRNVQLTVNVETHGNLDGLFQQLCLLLPENERESLPTGTMESLLVHIIDSDQTLQSSMLLKYVFRELVIGNLRKKFEQLLNIHCVSNDMAIKLAKLNEAKALVCERVGKRENANTNVLLNQASVRQQIKSMLSTLLNGYTYLLDHQNTMAASIDVYKQCVELCEFMRILDERDGNPQPLQVYVAPIQNKMSTCMIQHANHLWLQLGNSIEITSEMIKTFQIQLRTGEPYILAADRIMFDRINIKRQRLLLQMDAKILDEARADEANSQLDAASEDAQTFKLSYATYLKASESFLELVRQHLPTDFHGDLIVHATKSRDYVKFLHQLAGNTVHNNRELAKSVTAVIISYVNRSKGHMINEISAELNLDLATIDYGQLEPQIPIPKLGSVLPRLYLLAFDYFEIVPTLNENDGLRYLDNALKLCDLFLNLAENRNLQHKYKAFCTDLTNLRKLIKDNPTVAMKSRDASLRYNNALASNQHQMIIIEGENYAANLEEHHFDDVRTPGILLNVYRTLGKAYQQILPPNWDKATQFQKKAIATGVATKEVYEELITILQRRLSTITLDHLRADCKMEIEKETNKLRKFALRQTVTQTTTFESIRMPTPERRASSLSNGMFGSDRGRTMHRERDNRDISRSPKR